MADNKSTKLTIREDRPTAITSQAFGAHADALGFNLTFLALRNPKLAVQLLQLYDEAHQVGEDDPHAPDEDLELFAEILAKTLQGLSKED